MYLVYQIDVFGGTCLSVYSLQEASLVLDFITIEVYKTEWLLYIYMNDNIACEMMVI